MTRQWSRGEKWLFIWCGIFCLPLLIGSWVYERQNELPPPPRQTQEVPPQNNAFDLMTKAVAALPIVPQLPMTRYSRASGNSAGFQYTTIYPLDKSSQNGLALWRQSLKLPLYVGENTDDPGLALNQSQRWDVCRQLAGVAHVRAYACWQRGDRASALNWLLDEHRSFCRETTSFYDGENHPRGYAAMQNSIKARIWLVADFKRLMPQLNATELRYFARGLQQNRKLVPSLLKIVEASKSRYMARVYHLCAQNDLRLLDSEAKPELSKMTSSQQAQFRWRNKRLVLQELEKQCDWVITQARTPVSKRAHQYPDALKMKSGDPLRQIEFNLNVIPDFVNSENLDAQEIVFLTAMAVRAFELEQGHTPRTLNELVPNYLGEIDKDPFNPSSALRYLPTPKIYTQLYLDKPIYSSPLPVGAVPPPKRGYTGGFPVPIIRKGPAAPLRKPTKASPTGYYVTRKVQKLPFLLYSVGENGRDDGGMDFKATSATPIFAGQVPLLLSDDVLASLEWFTSGI